MADRGYILLAEDDDVDALRTKRTFEKAGLLNPLHIVTDGAEAIAYLSGEGQYANRARHPLPNLLLLDLKMPFKSGFEVLSWIRKQPALAGLRVFVLSGSAESHYMQAAYELGATFYLVKPLILDHLVQACGTVQDRWLCIGKPSASPSSHHN